MGYLQIDETAGGSLLTGMHTTVGFTSYSAAVNHEFNCTAQRTYFKTAGTYTFRLEAAFSSLNGSGIPKADANWPYLTAMYFPSSYGTVQTVSQSPNGDPNAKTVQVSDVEGNGKTTTAYDVDLRALELKATKAREEALRAELELRKARAEKSNFEK